MAIERLVPESADRIAIPQETSTNKCFTDESHVLRLLTISPLPVPPFQLYAGAQLSPLCTHLQRLRNMSSRS